MQFFPTSKWGVEVRNAAYVKLLLFGKLLRLHLFSRVDLAEALRDVYRNMPFHEFSSFISFILRQLHAIRDWPSRCFLWMFGSHQGQSCDDTWLAGLRAVTMESGFWPQENKPETAGTLWHDDDPALKPQGYQLCGS